MIVGYTSGVFDLFHVGHVNLLRNAKSLCDRLIVGVTVDELVQYKNKQPVISFVDRIEVVRSCRYVDLAIPQNELDKVKAMRRLNAHKLFVGDDWFGHSQWDKYESELASLGVDIVYFPYTQSTSSTLINETLSKLRHEE